MENNFEANLVFNDQVVEMLSQSIYRGEASLRYVPEFLKDLIIHNRWKKRLIRQTNQIQEFNDFELFVTSQPLEGLGTNLFNLKSLCINDPEAIRLLEVAVSQQDEKTIKIPYIVNKYKEKYPDLVEEFSTGSLSVRKIGLQLGFKDKRTRWFPADIEDTASKLIDVFQEEWGTNTNEALDELIKILSQYKRF
jgi:hypothetical protein